MATIAAADLAYYIGRGTEFPAADLPFVQRVIDAAYVAVGDLISDTADVPDQIFELAVLTVASELWHRRNMPGGVMQLGADGTGSVRLSYDVTRMVRPLLAGYTVAI